MYAICLASIHKSSMLAIAEGLATVSAESPSEPNASKYNFTNPAGNKIPGCNLLIVLLLFVERTDVYFVLYAAHAILLVIGPLTICSESRDRY